MSGLFKSTAFVTFYLFVSQLMAFALQVVSAYLFGAGGQMDAFNIAVTLPQYVSVVLLGSLGFVFLPTLMDYANPGQEEGAWRLISTMIIFCLVFVGAIALVGMCAPQFVVNLISSDLAEPTREIAVKLSVVLWPSVLANGLIVVLTGVYHSQSKFTLPALAPAIGTGVGLLTMLLLARAWGIFALALGTTLGLFFQVFLLSPILFKGNKYKFIFDWRHPGVNLAFRLLFPLALANITGKATGLVERVLASPLPTGSISHLTYALRLVTMLSLFFSSGVSVVIFRKMALDVNSGNLRILRRTISLGLRYLWLAIAPALVIGIVLSLPLVVIVFQRGEFSATDSLLVTRLFQVYLLSLAPSCFGNITARSFYALKDTYTLSWMVGLESVLYIIYTTWLSRNYGVFGIAFGYVILFNLSLIWQSLIIGYKTGRIWSWGVFISFARIFFAALLGGTAAWAVTQNIYNAWLEILAGGLAGLLVYFLALWSVKAPEIWELIVAFRRGIRMPEVV